MTSSANTVHIVGGGLAGSRGGVAARVGRRARRAARDAAGARHRGASHRQPRRAGLLQLLPLRRCRQQRRRPAARGDAPRRLADHARGRRPQAAGRRRARRRPPRLLGRRAGRRCSPIRWSSCGARKWPACRPTTGTASSSPPAPSPRRRWPRRSAALSGEESLAFFDAIAPIVHHESIDLSIAWKQSRYDKGGPAGDGADYLNCPLDQGASTTPSSRHCWPATRPSSRSGSTTRPTSTAASRSR